MGSGERHGDTASFPCSSLIGRMRDGIILVWLQNQRDARPKVADHPRPSSMLAKRGVHERPVGKAEKGYDPSRSF